MKKKHGKRHTAEQIIRKLREADTMLAAESRQDAHAPILVPLKDPLHDILRMVNENICHHAPCTRLHHPLASPPWHHRLSLRNLVAAEGCAKPT